MIELEDCGTEFLLSFTRMGHHYRTCVVPIMIIKAPRGCMALFDKGYVPDQCEAIKAFMDEHRND